NRAAERRFTLSMSIGSAPVDLDSGQTLDEMITHADAAMYADKAKKKKKRKTT
ncbi:MAG: diguanylate cyclase, partial [Acidobacteria bacterium]|nr:diguanylate cyclase [Acidobacteriota bacterium]